MFEHSSVQGERSLPAEGSLPIDFYLNPTGLTYKCRNRTETSMNLCKLLLEEGPALFSAGLLWEVHMAWEFFRQVYIYIYTGYYLPKI